MNGCWLEHIILISFLFFVFQRSGLSSFSSILHHSIFNFFCSKFFNSTHNIYFLAAGLSLLLPMCMGQRK